MRRSRPAVSDSYTGQLWSEPYVSPIDDIMQGKQSFYRRAERGAGVAYLITALTQPRALPQPQSQPGTQPGTQPPSPALEPAQGEESRRRDILSPPALAPLPSQVYQLARMACAQLEAAVLATFASAEAAMRAADWALRNDASVVIALKRLHNLDFEPYIKLLTTLAIESAHV